MAPWDLFSGPFKTKQLHFRQKQTLKCSKSLQLRLYNFHLILQKAIGRRL